MFLSMAAIVMMLGLVACSNSDDSPVHTHTVITDEAVSPTCTSVGKTQGSHCSTCSEVIVAQAEIPALGHSEIVIDAIPPTCTQSGRTESSYCSTCNKIIVAQEIINALGHNEIVDEAISPTCTLSGKTQGTHCSTCKEVFVEQEVIPALGHSEIAVAGVSPTCIATGLTVGTKCENCGITIVEQETIAASGHQYDNGKIILTATCSSIGLKEYTCVVANCNHSYKDTYSLPTYTATELYNQAVKYVGEIVTYDKSGAEYAVGTGFVISSDGKIVTNYHVIEGAYSAVITINNVKYTISNVLAYDANIDLAILKITATGLTAATICKLPVSVGETVYAIGSSRGLTNTYSQGIVAYANRVVDGVSHVQHDASITHGNSGGPLINIYGEVIGINTWGISDSQNLNFAVFTGELDNLVYGTPLTLAEFYALTNDPFDQLVDFILQNGQYNSNTDAIELTLVDEYQASYTEYHIVKFSYNAMDDALDLIYYVAFVNDDITFFTGITIEKDVSSYYYAMYVSVDGSTTNKISGYIKYDSFTRNTLLGYNSYEGKATQESLTRENASICAIYLVECLEWLVTNYLDLTVADFGFVSFTKN